MMLRPGSLLIQMCDSPRPSEAPARVVIYEPLITSPSAAITAEQQSSRAAEQQSSRAAEQQSTALLYHYAHSAATNIRAAIM
jgi:hypothetical protein